MNLSARASRIASAVVLCAGTAACAVAHAADAPYPTRSIRLIVASPTDGSTDSMARILAPKLGDAMGQTWVVDNRGGAGGNLGAEYAARAKPGGQPLEHELTTPSS